MNRVGGTCRSSCRPRQQAASLTRLYREDMSGRSLSHSPSDPPPRLRLLNFPEATRCWFLFTDAASRLSALNASKMRRFEAKSSLIWKKSTRKPSLDVGRSPQMQRLETYAAQSAWTETETETGIETGRDSQMLQRN